MRYIVIAVVERNKETCARTVRHFVSVVSVPPKTRQTVAVLKRRENCTSAGRQMVAMVPMFAVVAGVARNREPEACKRTVGQMVAVVRIVLRIILNVFFKIYLLSFVFVFIKLGKVSLDRVCPQGYFLTFGLLNVSHT